LRLRLVVPADVDTPTGGNAYDLALGEALRACGDEVSLQRCTAGDLAAVLSRPWRGHTLVDGLLALPEPGAVAATRPAVLVHMPLALETGLSRERAHEVDRLEHRALHAASTVIATSHWSARYLEQHHGVTGVAVAQPGSDPAPVSDGSDPPLLVQVAALVPHKDQLGVVAALARLADLPWQARLAGPVDRDPEYSSRVREAVRAAGLGARVQVTGPLPRDVAWAGADLALLPSRVESFGMVVTEALARGVPAVVSESGAAEALGVTATGERPGAVVPAGDVDTLAGVLRRWLTDPGLREAFRRAALGRRATLDRWEGTAGRVRQALRSR
jgi:glycosyltransferase involved in cell wall biosynthesis